MPKHEHEKMMNDLQRILKNQDFKSEKELQKFLESITGKTIPSAAAHNLSIEEQAEDLIYQAQESEDYDEAIEMAEGALDLDEKCIAAWEFLAEVSDCYPLKKLYFEKGISVGEEIFNKAFEKENKGHYWMINETRPYMRCMQRYSHLLNQYGSQEKSIELGKRIIKLNPNDNQGIRYLLMLQLIQAERYEEYNKFRIDFDNEPSAFFEYNHLLFLFKTLGDSAETKAQLSVAKKANKHIVKFLIAATKKRKEDTHYSPGQDSEAYSYIDFAYKIWQDAEGAVAWLKRWK